MVDVDTETEVRAQVAAWKYRLFELAIGLERRRAGLRETTVTVEGACYAYDDNQRQDAETVVLIHGFGADKNNWLRFAGALKRHYRVLAVDLLGHGRSSKPHDADYGYYAQARRVLAWLDAIGVGQCHVAGNSMGGGIATCIAAQAPARVRSLALLNAAAIKARDADLDRAIAAGRNPFWVYNRQDFQRLYAYAMQQPPWLPWPIKEIYAAQAIAAQPIKEWIWPQVRPPGEDAPLRDELRRVSAPALVLWGRQDRLLHVDNAAAIARELPQAATVIFDDLGHLPMLEAPRRVADTVRQFLAGVDARGA